MQLRSFKVEKKRWIEEELDIILKDELANQNSNIKSVIQPLKLYELVDVLYDFSEKFEQKGFSPKEIADVHFGHADEYNEQLNCLIEKVIKWIPKVCVFMCLHGRS